MCIEVFEFFLATKIKLLFGIVYLCVMKMNEPRYNDLSAYLSAHFPYKVQKISLNAGFTCPNRDGTVGYGGCTYCNNQTFNPAYCKTEKSVTEQLEEGKLFFARKYPDMKFLAYFQAYTNTYAELEELKRKYEEALQVKDVVGLVIGTRPDCMPDALLDYLEELNKRTFLIVEYGVESTDNVTLKRINRGHTFEVAEDGCPWHPCWGAHHPWLAWRRTRWAYCTSRSFVGSSIDYLEASSVAINQGHPYGIRV